MGTRYCRNKYFYIRIIVNVEKCSALHVDISRVAQKDAAGSCQRLSVKHRGEAAAARKSAHDDSIHLVRRITNELNAAPGFGGRL